MKLAAKAAIGVLVASAGAVVILAAADPIFRSRFAADPVYVDRPPTPVSLGKLASDLGIEVAEGAPDARAVPETVPLALVATADAIFVGRDRICGASRAAFAQSGCDAVVKNGNPNELTITPLLHVLRAWAEAAPGARFVHLLADDRAPTRALLEATYTAGQAGLEVVQVARSPAGGWVERRAQSRPGGSTDMLDRLAEPRGAHTP